MNTEKALRRIPNRLIGLTGGKGTGKDTVADHLCEIYAFQRFAFADKVRSALASLFDVDEVLFTDPAHKEDPHLSLFGRSPRYLMQTLGTEWGRDLVHPQLWIELMFRRVDMARSYGAGGIVVADVRFDGEAEAVKERGGVIWRIERPDPTYGTGDAHRSEEGVSPRLVDTIIHNNMDKRTLFTQVGVAIANLDRQPSRPDNRTPIGELSTL